MHFVVVRCHADNGRRRCGRSATHVAWPIWSLMRATAQWRAVDMTRRRSLYSTPSACHQDPPSDVWHADDYSSGAVWRPVQQTAIFDITLINYRSGLIEIERTWTRPRWYGFNGELMRWRPSTWLGSDRMRKIQREKYMANVFYRPAKLGAVYSIDRYEWSWSSIPESLGGFRFSSRCISFFMEMCR